MKQEFIELTGVVPEEMAGKRLDQVLAKLFPEHSRERLKGWVLSGECLIDGEQWRPKDKVSGGEQVELEAQVMNVTDWEPEDIPLDVLYEDDDLLVINKPADLVVHPAAGNRTGTLVNALLYHCPDLKSIPRAGVVHRLDKDTTGLMVVAKTLAAHTNLVEQLQARTVSRTYEAVVWGLFLAGGTIEKPIGRHPRERIKMAVVTSGKPAITHFRVLEKFSQNTHIQVQLETGRTHQIRVHMSDAKHPLVGDKTYGGRMRLPANASEACRELLQSFPRQALHAKKLGFVHPSTQEEVFWEAPLPKDMAQLLDVLRQ